MSAVQFNILKERGIPKGSLDVYMSFDGQGPALTWVKQTGLSIIDLQFKHVAYIIKDKISEDVWQIKVIKNRYTSAHLFDWCRRQFGPMGESWDILSTKVFSHPEIEIRGQENFVLWSMTWD